MAHIKKMVLHGFKSFARKTEIIFDKGINVVVGPNGSGKSNIGDALCFVLGRLSIKSMRAAKAKNLIFMGSKYIKPAKEAYVEIVFDNSDKAFSSLEKEITIRRTVRMNGQGIYKINNSTKTRTEVIETLAQAGIDPYGYNLIMQGEIQSIVRMHSDERRKIIEEVAGISIYEMRKEKSLKELEKTDTRLKEISTILRERNAYLNNLEKEKSQAQKYKEMKITVQRAKATIIKKKLEEKHKEIISLTKAIEEKTEFVNKKREQTNKIQSSIEKINERVNQINKEVQKASGMEQGRLREELTNLKADLEGLRVRKESYENRKIEFEKRITEMSRQVPDIQSEIDELRKEKPGLAKKAADLKKKKEEMAEIEKERKIIITLKTELNSLRERNADKQKQLARTIAESESLVKQMEELSKNYNYSNEKECADAIDDFQNKLKESKEKLTEFHKQELENEKIISLNENEIKRNEEIKNKIEKIDTCPLCQSKMTKEHVGHVFKEADEKIISARKELEKSNYNLEKIKRERTILRAKIEEIENKISSAERELTAQKSINEKRKLLKNSIEYEKILKSEINELENRRNLLENKTTNLSEIEAKYDEKLQEIEEISSRTGDDVDTTLLYKERESEKIKSIISRSKEDLIEIINKIKELTETTKDKESQLNSKEEKEKELNARFEKMFKERDALQIKSQEENTTLINSQNEVRQIEDQTNYLKIGKAKLDGERETIEIDLQDFQGIEILQGSLNFVEEKLEKTQKALENIGSINMRALEVYDEVKKEYDIVKEKVETLENEKIEILKIVEEIDKKKKNSFMKTFRAINHLFSENFSRLSTKGGTAYLEIENKENIFDGGINIVVKLTKGKYFDVASLSGGEKTLVALSLLFSIQEYKPYQFYILDEIDAALDKRNSERLAALLKQYMKEGQYIIVSHNDAIITNAEILYGISMHDGVSKILSLEVKE